MITRRSSALGIGKPSRIVLSLRSKLLVFSLLLVVVPGFTFAFLAFSAAHEALRDAAGLQLVEAARDQADAISGEITNLRNDLHRWARTEVMREIRDADVDERISRMLQSIPQDDSYFLDVLCADNNGVVIAASSPDRIGHSLDIRGLPPKRPPTSASTPSLRGPVSDPRYPHLFLEAFEPIPDPDRVQERIGTLVALYDLASVDRAADQIRRNLAELGSAVDVSVLDADGVVIAGSWREGSPGWRGQNLRRHGWQTAQAKLPSGDDRGFAEEPTVGLFAGHSEIEGVAAGWRVLVTQPMDDALSPVAELRRIWTLAFSGVIVAGLLLAALLADRLVRPLRALTAATRRIRFAPEDTQPLPITSGDEIGQLTESFNAMAEELRGARRELINAARLAMVGEMAAGIAHEVRTPLGILRTSAQVLKRSIGDRNPKEAELADILVAETDRLSHVVTELLDLSRPKIPAAHSTPLYPVLERAVDFVRAQATERGISVRMECDEAVPPAWCDPEHIYQVALNLIVNATQSLEAGGTVRVRLENDRSGRVAFSVRDDGPGVPADLQEDIFTPFFTTRQGGIGLGLALVERIVAAHRGTVALSSREGEGTTFRVTLPAAEEVA